MIRSEWESGHPEQTRFGEGGKVPTAWECSKGHANAKWAANCMTPHCGEKRPK